MRNRLGGVIRSERLQFRQILPMIGQADRDDGKRCDAGMKLQQILNCPLQMLAVIETGTQHHLAMQLYSAPFASRSIFSINPSYSGLPSSIVRSSGSVA